MTSEDGVVVDDYTGILKYYSLDRTLFISVSKSSIRTIYIDKTIDFIFLIFF